LRIFPATPSKTERCSPLKRKFRFPFLCTQLISNSPCASSYERKKQKAKVGRIQLNLSIEALSEAIENASNTCDGQAIALNQCTKSAKQLFDTDYLARLSSTTIVASRAKLLDRPSFFGVSAEMIRSLTTLSDIAFAELFDLRQLEKERNAKSGKKRKTLPHPSPCLPHNASSDPDPMGSLRSLLSDFHHVTSFLSAGDVGRLAAVSRTLRHHHALTDPNIWSELYQRRFGTDNFPSGIPRHLRHSALNNPRTKYRLVLEYNGTVTR